MKYRFTHLTKSKRFVTETETNDPKAEAESISTLLLQFRDGPATAVSWEEIGGEVSPRTAST